MEHPTVSSFGLPDTPRPTEFDLENQKNDTKNPSAGRFSYTCRQLDHEEVSQRNSKNLNSGRSSLGTGLKGVKRSLSTRLGKKLAKNPVVMRREQEQKISGDLIEEEEEESAVSNYKVSSTRKSSLKSNRKNSIELSTIEEFGGTAPQNLTQIPKNNSVRSSIRMPSIGKSIKASMRKAVRPVVQIRKQVQDLHESDDEEEKNNDDTLSPLEPTSDQDRDRRSLRTSRNSKVSRSKSTRLVNGFKKTVIRPLTSANVLSPRDPNNQERHGPEVLEKAMGVIKNLKHDGNADNAEYLNNLKLIRSSISLQKEFFKEPFELELTGAEENLQVARNNKNKDQGIKNLGMG